MAETQPLYSQIENETLAIEFAVKKISQYLFGQTFILESDYKPLQSIFKKPLKDIPLRLKRMLFSLTEYDLEVVHKTVKNYQTQTQEKLLNERTILRQSSWKITTYRQLRIICPCRMSNVK